MRPLILTAALTLSAATAAAQAGTATPPPPQEKPTVWSVLRLPKQTDEARKAGVPDSSVKSVLDILREKKVPPAEQEEILIAHKESVEEHGPTDNFGAFVQSQLAQGKRGRELSAAIRAEHAARGKGKGRAKKMERMETSPDAHVKGEAKAKPSEKGKPDAAGTSDAAGKPSGKPDGKGKPDDAGKGRKP